MDKLKKELKDKTVGRLYLFYGEESYLTRYYTAQMKKAVLGEAGDMCLTMLSGKEASAESIFTACETLPFFGGRRLIIARESGLFTSGRKDETEAVAEYLSDIPESACLLFVESVVDKRQKAFKRLCEYGSAVEFARQTEAELRKWLVSMSAKDGILMPQAVAAELMRTVGMGMDTLYAEWHKLRDYCAGGEVKLADIEAVCVKSSELKAFEIVSAIGKKDVAKALRIYSGLLANKESPYGTLALIARQFRIMIQCRCHADKGVSTRVIASELGLQSFFVNDYLSQSKNFTPETLLAAFEDCLETEYAAKSGQIDIEQAVELLVAKYAAKG